MEVLLVHGGAGGQLGQVPQQPRVEGLVGTDLGRQPLGDVVLLAVAGSRLIALVAGGGHGEVVEILDDVLAEMILKGEIYRSNICFSP